MKVLHLTLKKKWFDMIASGEKTEEYRDIKPYWHDRLYDFAIVSRNNSTALKKPIAFKKFHCVQFKNGYSKNASTMSFWCLGIEIRKGNPEWGAIHNELYFVIKLGERIKP